MRFYAWNICCVIHTRLGLGHERFCLGSSLVMYGLINVPALTVFRKSVAFCVIIPHPRAFKIIIIFIVPYGRNFSGATLSRQSAETYALTSITVTCELWFAFQSL